MGTAIVRHVTVRVAVAFVLTAAAFVPAAVALGSAPAAGPCKVGLQIFTSPFNGISGAAVGRAGQGRYVRAHNTMSASCSSTSWLSLDTMNLSLNDASASYYEAGYRGLDIPGTTSGTHRLRDLVEHHHDASDSVAVAAAGESSAKEVTTGGYLLAAADGGVFAFGRRFLGSAASLPLADPVVDIASTPSGNGYWLAAADGGVFAFGVAQFYGSLAGMSLGGPVVAIVAAPDGRGYWLAAADGGVFAFGSARFEGGPAPEQLEAPVVGMARTADGAGYSLLTGSGQVFAFGSALAAYAPLRRLPVRNGGYVGMTELPGTEYGLWLVEAGGYQVLSNAGVGPPPGACSPLPGDALVLRAPVVDVAGREPFEECQRWLAASDGGVFSYRSPFLGSMGDEVLTAPVVAVAE